MNAAARGAGAGLAGTVVMTIAMEWLWRRLPENERYPLPPREIIDRILPADVQNGLGERACQHLTLAAHFGFGAAVGALFPMLTNSRQLRTGAAYGFGVWAASYCGWIPALRILKPAHKHPTRRNLLMIGAHLIWGAGTALALRELERVAGAPKAAGLHPPDAGQRQAGPNLPARTFQVTRKAARSGRPT